MVNKEFFAALEALQISKNINEAFIIDALESALTAAYKKSIGQAKSAQVRLNPTKKTIEIYSYLTIVEEVTDEDKQISLVEAQAINTDYNVGDTIMNEESFDNFNRIAAQTAKQVITQKIKEVERQEMMNDIAEKEGTLVTSIVQRIDGENVYLEIGGTSLEGLLTERDVLPTDAFRVGDRVKVYVKPIKDEFKTGIVQVTRTSVSFVKKLFELEVPEIQNGDITIVNMVREPGNRTKMSVVANQNGIDVLGACIGNKGARINAIINELHGEKIDVVPYSDDICEYISSALNPATVLSVTTNVDIKAATVVVPENKFSLAIGKGGQNVRLAAKLTGWKIDVKSESLKTAIEQGIVGGSNIIVDEGDANLFTEIDV